MKSPVTEFAEHTVVIHGVGLIGGSLALAIKRRAPACRVIGIGRSEERLAAAVHANVIDAFAVSANARSCPAGSLGIVCLPVDQIPRAAKQLLEAGCSAVTDAGSVKSSICRAMSASADGRFVGSHPIAGSEHSGFEHADARLFDARTCVITPEHSSDEAVRRVTALWSAVGMRVCTMSPDEHDRVLALTSHLPHVLASVAAAAVPESLLPFTGTGYRDTTRIAAGVASVWTSILLDNASHCIDAIASAERRLQHFREALQQRDMTTLERLWNEAAEIRRLTATPTACAPRGDGDTTPR